MRYSSSKTCATMLALLIVVLVSRGAEVKGDNASGESRTSHAPEKDISIFSIKGRPAKFTGKGLATALFQKLTLDEIWLVKNPLARTPAMNA